MAHDTLVTRWSHHDFDRPLPLVPRHSIEVGDIIDSSHYGKVEVIEVQRTAHPEPHHSVGWVMTRPGEPPMPGFVWVERYPGDSTVPLYEKHFAIWVCSAAGHGYHDTEHPCPLGLGEGA